MKLNKIGIGTAQFGLNYGISNTTGKVSISEVKDIIDISRNEEIRYIDTAAGYGEAEKILGENNLDDFRIVSKFLPQEKNSNLSIQLNKTLRNLNAKKIYGYLAHRPRDLANNERQWNQLLELKFKDKIRKIGISVNSLEEINIFLDKGRIPDLIQVPYNYLDNRFKEKIIELKEVGCEIHARSIFLQGLFFMNKEILPQFFDEIKNDIHFLQIKYKDLLPNYLLNYVLEKNFIDVAIFGITSKDQFINNIKNLVSTDYLKDRSSEISNNKILMPSEWPK